MWTATLKKDIQKISSKGAYIAVIGRDCTCVVEARRRGRPDCRQAATAEDDTGVVADRKSVV